MKNQLRNRTMKHGTNSFVIVAIFVAILTIVNFILARHELRFDFSDSGTFSLSGQTELILENLQEEVTITGFFSSQSKVKARAEDLFKNYTHQSENVHYVIVDPDKKPALAQQYGITDYDTVILELGGRKIAARAITEEGLTSALIRISRNTKKTLYFVEGHGEHSINDTEKAGYSFLADTLVSQGFIVKALPLLTKNRVPKDADVVIISGPKRPFTQRERESLKNYLDGGGQVFFLLDPELGDTSGSGLENFFSAWGAKLDNGLILDPSSGLGITIPTLNPGAYLSHVLTENFNLATFFPVTRAVSFDPELGKGYRFDPFLETTLETWFTQEISGDLSIDPNRDLQGPISFGGVFYASDKTNKMRLVIIGDSDFATNSTARSAGNGDLFQNVLSWLADEGDLLSIRPQEVPATTLVLSAQQMNMIFSVSVFILPLTVMGIGLYIWRGRRRL